MEKIVADLKLWQERKGLNNSQLAKELNTSQQSVSRWMRGEVKPSGKMKQEIKQLIDISTTSVPSTLPLQDLPWDKFEKFCLNLAVLRGYQDAILYGKQGELQKGIDIICQENDLVIQCKQTVQPKWKLAKTIEAINDYEKYAQQHKIKILAITAEPDIKSIDYAKEHGWVIYGLNKLTEEVGLLQDRQRIFLTRKYFPNRYIDLLKVIYNEIRIPSITPSKEYFESIKKDMFIDFEIPFIKNNNFDSIEKALNTPQNKVVMISGFGGMGKTRLIKELSEKSNKDFYIYIEEGPLSIQDISILDSECILVIDDAHQKLEVVEQAIEHIYHTNEDKTPKLLICTRPIHKETIENTINSHRLANEIFNLEKLNCEQSIELADKIYDNNIHTPYISELADGNPLILTLIAKYARDNHRIPKNLLEDQNTENFIRAVFKKTIDENLNTTQKDSPSKDMLKCISILQPFPMTEENINILSEFLKCTPRDIERSLNLLKRNNLLVDTINGLRFYPDLLGDYLRDDIITNDEHYCKDILENFKGKFLENILQNISLLDWSTSHEKVSKEQLNLIWEEVKNQVSSPLVYSKQNIFSSIYQTASLHPEMAIDFVNYVATSVPEFVPKLPKILTQTASQINNLETSIRTIYDLAAKFPKINAENIEMTPLAALKEILRYSIFKRAEYNIKAMEYCIKYYPDNNRVPFDLLDVLDETHKINGISTLSNAPNVAIQNFTMNPDSIKPIIQTVTGIISQKLCDQNIQQSLRATTSIENLFQHLGRQKEYKNILKDIYHQISDIIAQEKLSPIIIACIQKGLARYTQTLNPKERINFENYSKLDEYIISVAIIDRYHNDIFTDEDRSKGRANYINWLERASHILIKHNSSNYNKLIEKIAKITTILDDSNSARSTLNSRLFDSLCKESKSFCKNLILYIFAHPLDDTSIGFQLGPALSNLCTVHTEKDFAIEYGLKAVESNRDELKIGAIALLYSKLYSKSRKEINQLIDELLKNDNEVINDELINAALYVKKDDPKLSELIAKKLFEKPRKYKIFSITNLFDPEEKILSLSSLSKNNIKSLIDNLVEINNLNDYDIDFLRNLSKQHPDSVAELFERRIDKSLEDDPFSTAYSPIPYRTFLNISNSQETKFLNHVVDWLKNNSNSSHIQFYAPKLLKFAFSNDSLILHKISELLDSQNTNWITVRILIESLNTEALWKNQNDIESILNLSYRTKSLDEYNFLCSAFMGLWITDGYIRVRGHYSPHDIEIINNIETALAKTPESSKIYPIFQKVKQCVKHNMEEDLKYDNLFEY